MIHQPRVPAGTGGPPEDWAEPGAQPWELAWADQPEIALALGGEPLSLDQTLGCGQAFRWQPRGPEAWEGVAGNRAWRLERSAGVLYARVVPALPADEARQFLSRYFALDLAAAEIAAAVGAAHPAAARAAEQFEGLRILRQEPLETLLTFAIATATNVPRVTRSVAAVCTRFGDRIATVDGVDYHAFPRPQQLLAAPTVDLFGPCNLAYRARSLQALCAALPALLRSEGE
jgi:N-glycosylase/DNA lyase